MHVVPNSSVEMVSMVGHLRDVRIISKNLYVVKGVNLWQYIMEVKLERLQRL